MKRFVVRDFEYVIGGPVGPRMVIAIFRKGEELEVRRANGRHEYPKTYTVAQYPHLGEMTRGVLTQFLKGFEPRKKKKSE